MAHHNTLFHQMLNFIPRHQFQALEKAHGTGRKSRSFSLIRHGFAVGNDVIEKIKELRKNTADFSDPSPETKEQINMVINWTEGL